MEAIVRNASFATSVFLTFALITQVACSGIFELQLKSFSNDAGIDADGKCCGGAPFDLSRPCPQSCNTFFRVCLRHYQQTINVNDECTFGQLTTKVLGANSFDVPQHQSPLMLNISFAWKGDFTLILEAWHENPSQGGRGSQLITRLADTRRLAVGETWVDDAHHSGRVSMQFSYRFVCQHNYYGEKCVDYCQPRDDRHGHYTCSEDGKKICNAGWKGDYCNVAICRADCDENHGVCDLPGECKCRKGWKGALCQECETYPGCDHGTCTKPFECNCDKGWGGMFCNQDLNYCTHNRPCRNGGTCRNAGQGGFTCDCPDNYSGDRCEVLSPVVTCQKQPCINGGTCKQSTSGAHECVCPIGYYGRFCELGGQTCDDRPCENGATCVPQQDGVVGANNGRKFECLCTAGYTGPTCSHNACLNDPCQNGGKCSTGEFGEITCQCPPGYAGRRCETRRSGCDSNPCANGGTCFDLEGGAFTCRCNAGYVGKECKETFKACSLMPCTNGGSCVEIAGGFKCECPEGYTGEKCESDLDECAVSQPCVHGDCFNKNGYYECRCYPGYGGANCDVAYGAHTTVVDPITTGVTKTTGSLSDGDDNSLTTSELIAVVCLGVGVTVVILIVVVFILCRQRRANDRQRDMHSHSEQQTKLNNKVVEMNQNALERGYAAGGGVGGGNCGNGESAMNAGSVNHRLTPTSNICNNVFVDINCDGAGGKDYDKRAFSPNGGAISCKNENVRASQRASTCGTLSRPDKNQLQQQQQQQQRSRTPGCAVASTKELSVEHLVSKYHHHQQPGQQQHPAAVSAVERDTCMLKNQQLQQQFSHQQQQQQRCSSPSSDLHSNNVHCAELTKVDNRASTCTPMLTVPCGVGKGAHSSSSTSTSSSQNNWMGGITAPSPALFAPQNCGMGANQNNNKNFSSPSPASPTPVVMAPSPSDCAYPVYTIGNQSSHLPSSSASSSHQQYPPKPINTHHQHNINMQRPVSPHQQQNSQQSQLGNCSGSSKVDNNQLSTAV